MFFPACAEHSCLEGRHVLILTIIVYQSVVEGLKGMWNCLLIVYFFYTAVKARVD